MNFLPFTVRAAVVTRPPTTGVSPGFGSARAAPLGGGAARNTITRFP